MRCIFSFVNFGILACESMNVFLHMSRMYDNFSILQQIFYLLGICDKLYLDRCLNHSLLFVRVIQIRLLRCVDSQLRFSPAYSLTIWNMLNYMKQSIFVCLFVSFDFDLVHSTTTGYRLPLNPFLSITSDRFTLIGAQINHISFLFNYTHNKPIYNWEKLSFAECVGCCTCFSIESFKLKIYNPIDKCYWFLFCFSNVRRAKEIIQI